VTGVTGEGRATATSACAAPPRTAPARASWSRSTWPRRDRLPAARGRGRRRPGSQLHVTTEKYRFPW